MATFIDSVMAFMQTHDFNGLNLGFLEKVRNIQNYIVLLRELRERSGARYELIVGMTSKLQAENDKLAPLMAIQDIVDTITVWTIHFTGHGKIPNRLDIMNLTQCPEAEVVAPQQSEWGTNSDLRALSERRAVSVEIQAITFSCIAFQFEGHQKR